MPIVRELRDQICNLTRDSDKFFETKYGTITLTELVHYILDQTHRAREDAGYGGEMGDRGASATENQLLIFIHGLRQELPSIWEPVIAEAVKHRDPEYHKYLQLKKKFGD